MGLNSVFILIDQLLTKMKQFILSIAGERIAGIVPFPTILVLCEMQIALSSIWTQVSGSISSEDDWLPPKMCSKCCCSLDNAKTLNWKLFPNILPHLHSLVINFVCPTISVPNQINIFKQIFKYITYHRQNSI